MIDWDTIWVIALIVPAGDALVLAVLMWWFVYRPLKIFQGKKARRWWEWWKK